MRVQPLLSIVVPAYNEQDRLAPTIQAYLGHCRDRQLAIELIVVDDGSLDATSALVESMSAEYPEIRLIRLAENRGKGYAVRTGVVNARGRLVLFADADGATPISELGRLEAAIQAGADVAIGSRALLGGGVRVKARLYRRLMGRAFHLLVETLTVRDIKDTQCGFKLFRGPVAHDLFSRMRMTGFSFDVEVLMMAQRRGYRIAEVPVNWVHQPGSKVNLAVDSMRMVRDLFIIRGRHLSGEYSSPHLAPLVKEGLSQAADEPDSLNPKDMALTPTRL
ncbi:MAG: glycosyltransferase family 2 protein [Gemmatimonadales bacterium]|nr:glycosyltransferase family 2 protein [Gemmatimonadales bacterium]